VNGWRNVWWMSETRFKFQVDSLKPET
jgi:hypothetical protein